MWGFLTSENFPIKFGFPLLKQQGLALAGGAGPSFRTDRDRVRLSLSLRVSAEEPVLITNERERETPAPSATASLNRARVV